MVGCSADDTFGGARKIGFCGNTGGGGLGGVVLSVSSCGSAA